MKLLVSIRSISLILRILEFEASAGHMEWNSMHIMDSNECVSSLYITCAHSRLVHLYR
jgi:hypothetical protein